MRTRTVVLAIVLVAAATLRLATPTAMAQHETASDLLDGERAYGQRCVTCHGPDGNIITGIDLARGQFRRQMTDDDLVRIIRTGIPNTPMPASNMTVEQAQQIVAYLRARAASARAGTVRGDAARGHAIVDGKGRCTTCHRIDAVGSGVGPELTRIGSVRGAKELERSLVEPDAEVQPTDRFYRVVLRDGTIVTGRLLSHDTFTVQMLDTSEKLRSFPKSGLREFGFIASPMPSYRATLSPQEIADVVSYLASLKGRE